jgi:squalene cyclase
MSNGPSPFFFVGFGVVVLYLASVMVLANRLKRHPEAWEKAGCFGLILNNTPISGWKFLKFVISSDYKALNDQTLTQMLWTTRGLFAAALVMILWNFAAVWTSP